MLEVNRYSRKHFEEEMKNSNVIDSTVGSSKDYFICINATGWIHGVPYFKEEHHNVINLYFDDVYKTGLKVIPWYNNDQRIIYAQACTIEQAVILKKFISNIPYDSIVHVYCAKGKSRSKGVEVYINEYCNNRPADTDGVNSNVYNLLKRV